MRRLRSAYTAAVLGLATLGVVAAGGISQAQDAGVKLFKLITAKDEIVVGITDAEMKSFGAAPTLKTSRNASPTPDKLRSGVTR